MTAAIHMQGVIKRYAGAIALSGLDLKIPRGVVSGLVGPNGAGKTTALSVTAGLIRHDGGDIDVLGNGPFDARRHAGRLSLLPQDCALNPYLPVNQLLEFLGRLQGLTSVEARREVDRVLELVELRDRAEARIGQLSHGMRRRVAIAQALLGTPELVLLDEPMSGLDPHLVARMRDTLLEAARSSTVVISSHILSELETICDHVVFMQGGVATRSGDVSEITGATHILRIRLGCTPAPGHIDTLTTGFAARLDGDTLVIELPAGMDPASANRTLLPILLGAGLDVVEIQLGRSLEESYLERYSQVSPVASPPPAPPAAQPAPDPDVDSTAAL